MGKVSIFFEVEGLVKIDIDLEDPKDIDVQSWVSFAELVKSLPDTVSFSDASIKYINNPELNKVLSAAKELAEPSVEESPGGIYL
jgi:hypothetical protein